ncbi:MAG TPA: hypothetical protein VFH97_03510 [Gemmatimonadales bacterium]|nr:hypothetical protein [Gemmatimonadales bacterium]
MAGPDSASQDYVPLAEIEVDAVLPRPSGFLLEGQGADGANYRLELHLDHPVDRRTQQVLGEILSQSEWRVLRRATPSPIAALRRARATRPKARPGQPDSR